MATARSYTFRITAEGVDAFARDLGQLGQQSDVAQRAVERLLQSSPSLSGALTKAGQAADQAAARMGATAGGSAAMAQGLGQAGAAAGVTARQVQQLIPQINDLFTSIASGGPVLLALTQQAGQITPIFGGIKGTVAAAASALGTAGIAAGAVALALGGVVLIANSTASALDDMGDRLRATRADYLALATSAETAARAMASSSQFGLDDTRKAATTIAGSAQFSGSRADLDALLRTAGDLSRVMGTDLPAAAELVAKALKDPGAVARQLAEEDFRGLNETVARQVELMQLAGDKAGATATVMRVLSDTSRGAAADMAPLNKAWQEFKDRLQSAWDTMRPAAEFLGSTVLRGLSELLRLVKELDDYANNNPLGRLLGFAGAGAAPADGGGAGQNAARRSLDDALRRAREANPRERQAEDARANMAVLRAGLANPEANADDRRTLAGALREQQAALAGLRGPVAEYLTGLRDQTAAAKLASGAARELAAAETEARKIAERDGVNGDTAAREARVEAQRRLNEQLITYRVQISDTVNGNQDIAEAWKSGADAAALMTLSIRAQREALDYAERDTEEYNADVRALEASFIALRQSEQAIRDAQQIDSQAQQLAMLREEGKLLSANAEIRARELAMLKERQALVKEGADLENLTAEQTQRIANAAAIASETAALTRQRDAMGELQRLGETAFDRVGQAITTAFTSGSLKAISFGSIVKGVLSEVVQYIAKIAVLRPVMNYIFGTSQATAADLFGGGGGGSGGGGGAGGSGGGLFDTAQTLYSWGKNIYSLYDKVSAWFGSGSSATFSGAPAIEAALGYEAVAAGAVEAGSGVTISGASAVGGGASTAGGAATSAGFLSGTGGTVLGAAAYPVAGIGIGFAAGSVIGNALAGDNPNRQQNAQYGAGGGALAGAAIGMIAGPVGAAIGAIIGGIVGGAGGGLIGPTPHPGGDVGVSVRDDGLLSITSVRGKSWDAMGAQGEVQGQVDRLNTELTNRGLKFSNTGAVASVVGFGKFTKNAGNIIDGFSSDWAGNGASLRALTSADGRVQEVINSLAGRGEGLEKILQGVDFVQQVVIPMTAAVEPMSDYAAAVKTITDQYDPAIAKARELGISEAALTAARDERIGKIDALRDAELRKTDANLSARLAAARGDGTQSGLITFDEQAIQEREAYRKQLEQLGLSTGQVADRLAGLADVLAAERAAILDAPRQQAAGSAAGVIQALGGYASGLLSGGASALSPEEKYALASSNFDRIAIRAAAGDLGAASSLQGYSDTLLASSRDLNGSGVGYRSDFSRVVSALESVAGQGGDALTASAMMAATEKQTDVLERSLRELTAEVVALRREVAQGNLTPSRA